MKIHIPFKQKMKKLIIAGKKTATTRTRRYGEVGDTFTVSDKVFKIWAIRYIILDTVAKVYYEKEGFQSPEEFIKYWNSLHEQKYEDNPNRLVYLHIFYPYKGGKND